MKTTNKMTVILLMLNYFNLFSKPYLENANRAKINIIIRAYNDGVAFRYELPDKGGGFKG